MRFLFKSLTLLLLCCFSIYADFCQEISDDLRIILQKTEAINGEFTTVIPFPDQGGSFINQVYLVCTDQDEMLVLKVENKNWEREKTLNEVAALEYLNRNTTIPVPKVLAYESAIHDSLIGHEYILMTRVSGTPLNHEFERIYANPELYSHVLEQLADVLAELKQQTFSSIGSLRAQDSTDIKCPIDFANLGYETGCRMFSEYALRWMTYYLSEMKILRDAGHQNAKYFEKHISQLEQLIESPNLCRLDKPEETFPFSHQDFVMKNILIDDETITAILDWEWSGSAPSEFEIKTGCDFLKTPQDVAKFNSMLEQRGVSNFFDPPHPTRQIFYQLMGELYTIISCYEWIEGKLVHSAKFLNQKLEQRFIRNSKNFDMRSYVDDVSSSLDIHFNKLNQELS